MVEKVKAEPVGIDTRTKSRALISYVDITNFMSLSHARIEFDDSNIIVLKGYNNSGKSAIVKAVEVCLLGRYESKQASFIRDSETRFEIRVGFSDGVEILREKRADGKSLYEMSLGGKKVFTSKQGSAYAKVTGVPEEIRAYVGATEMDDRWLNSAAGNEPMLLTDTTGSENFRAISDVLKAEELHKALTAVRADMKDKQDEIVYVRARRERVAESRDVLPTVEQVGVVKEAITTHDGEIRTLGAGVSGVAGVVGAARSLAALRPAPAVGPLGASLARAVAVWLGGCLSLPARVPAAVPGAPGGVLAARVASAVGRAAALRALGPGGPVGVLVDSSALDLGKSLGRLEGLLEKLQAVEGDLEKVEAAHSEALGVLDEMVKQVGDIPLFTCPECGRISLGSDGCAVEGVK